MKRRINNGALALIERGYALAPQRRASVEALAQTKIISHRGERDNQGVSENTFAAFDPLLDSGVWGIEFDLRWTRDLEPVVCHDPDLKRVFGLPLRLADTSYATLRARCPQVPHLGELLQRYGKRIHLMLEIKDEPYLDPERQRTLLAHHLAGLTPGTDFHILALDTDLFAHTPDLPAVCWLPVAKLNIARMSAFALKHQCAGVAAAFMALGPQTIARHHQQQQVVGVGFPTTRRLVHREVNRGVDWLFANRALRLLRYTREP